MSSIEIKYEDLKLLMDYLEKTSKGQNILLEVSTLETSHPRLYATFTNNKEESIKILLFCQEASLFPKIITEDRLSNVL